ncbi:MAG: S8 family peptidase [Gammaproteobacteria bacterium]|nr:S8 family peptidase [Gammaproteobacteria bacterium]
MRSSCLRRWWLAGVLLAALGGAHGQARPSVPSSQQAPASAADRFIVKLRATAISSGREAAPQEVGALATHHGLDVVEARHIVSGMHLLRVRGRSGASAAQTLATLREDPRVEFAEPDYRRHALAAPNDTLFGNQWYLQNSQPAATNAVAAWNSTTGSAGLVIADLDTGVRFDHPDLRNSSANRLLPGYNMISDPTIANNSSGRGPDASDPGDWISQSDLKNSLFANCKVTNSSWHGTRTAGILGAITDNAAGIAGMTWKGWIEPVRVLGKCGGYDSDIIAGMAWAAGNPVDGLPSNPYPASILNMSLGRVGTCPASYQQMVDELVQEGVLIVVAAGNEGGPVDAPANCPGVAAVAGLRQAGSKVGYSSLGPEVTLGAPAGNCVNTGAGEPCLFSILTTTNSGTTSPQTNTYTTEYDFNVGTSFAAPIVSAIAGLMLSANGNLTSGQLIARLQAGATAPFPLSPDAGVPTCHVPSGPNDLQSAECNCTTQTCGAGMANADGAVNEALRPIAAIATPPAYVAGGNVLLDAAGSAASCNASIAAWHWSVLQPTSNPPVIGNANGPQASLVAPQPPLTYTLELTVTDNYGRTDTASVLVGSKGASSSAPARAGDRPCLAAVSYSVPVAQSVTPPATGGGGGGGSLDLFSLAMLALGGVSSAAWRSHSRRCAASSHDRCARR